jgi:hypothetical protein
MIPHPAMKRGTKGTPKAKTGAVRRVRVGRG